MLIYDDIFSWDGFGGRLKLPNGRCRLRIIDQKKSDNKDLTFIKPILIIVSDTPGNNIPGNKLSVKSCAGHIATLVTQKFNIDPNRMFWVEYYNTTEYGPNSKKVIPEKFEHVEFEWHDGKAIHPKWRPLPLSVIDIIKSVIIDI